MQNDRYASELVSVLLARKLEISTAESCTGGLLSKYLTDQAGVSGAFQCGVVSYSGKIKHRVLGVSDEILTTFGEVSAETAKEMAMGIRAVSGADIGVGITGIAGPGGGSTEKPVGLVYFSVSFGDKCEAIRLELFDEPDRKSIREKTVESVLTYLLELLR